MLISLWVLVLLFRLLNICVIYVGICMLVILVNFFVCLKLDIGKIFGIIFILMFVDI